MKFITKKYKSKNYSWKKPTNQRSIQSTEEKSPARVCSCASIHRSADRSSLTGKSVGSRLMSERASEQERNSPNILSDWILLAARHSAHDERVGRGIIRLPIHLSLDNEKPSLSVYAHARVCTCNHESCTSYIRVAVTKQSAAIRKLRNARARTSNPDYIRSYLARRSLDSYCACAWFDAAAAASAAARKRESF